MAKWKRETVLHVRKYQSGGYDSGRWDWCIDPSNAAWYVNGSIEYDDYTRARRAGMRVAKSLLITIDRTERSDA